MTDPAIWENHCPLCEEYESECTCAEPVPHLANLADYEMGYDRHYIGIGLHCRRCMAEDPHEDIETWGFADAPSLADIVALADEHELTHHQEEEHGSTQAAG